VHDGQKVEMNFISKQLHMKYPVVVSIGIIQKESSFKYDGINLKKNGIIFVSCRFQIDKSKRDLILDDRIK
jgi:hypothetical protein